MPILDPIPSSPPIPSTPWLRRLATAQSAIRKPDYRPYAVPAAILLLWTAATTFGWVDTRILVSPWATAVTGWRMVTHASLWRGLGFSLARDASGFAIGSIAGVVIGTLLGTSRFADRTIGPTFHAYKQIALFAWIPLIAVWFGMKEHAKIAFVALATVTPVLLNTIEGVRSVSRDHAEVARAFEFTRWQLYRRVILPSATPQILTGLRLGLINAWIGTIGAEYFFASAPGVGNILIDGREHFLMDQVIVGIAVVGIVGYAFHLIAGRIEARLLRWRQRQPQT